MVMVVVIILVIVQLLLIGGLDSIPAESKNETTKNSIRRILHGENTDITNFRFMVRVISKGSCTGSIIAKNWVLTAAHCIHNTPCANIDLFPVIWEDNEKINPSQCYSHEEYHPFYQEHDIALLKVEKQFYLDQRARALNLPPPGKYYPPGTPAVIIGWGRNERNESPGKLLHGEVKLASRDVCTSQFTAYHSECKDVATCGDILLPLRMVCAIAVGSTPPGICYGDSGGPIIADLNVVGIATMLISPSIQCEVGAPSAFLSIVDYLPWIYGHIEPWRDTSQFPVGPEHRNVVVSRKA